MTLTIGRRGWLVGLLIASLGVACGRQLTEEHRLEQQAVLQVQQQQQQIDQQAVQSVGQQQQYLQQQHQQQDGATEGEVSPEQALDATFQCPESNSSAELPLLRIEQVLRSNKTRQPTDVTLVTQLSFERLYMLEGQCDVWSGVVSGAVYIALVKGRAVIVELNSNQDPMLAGLDLVRHRFEEFHRMAEAKGQCKLDLQLVSQEVESVWLSGLYPVNAMRNRALAGAETEVVLLLDVDFWPSVELSELMQKPAKYQSMLAAVTNKNAIVLPAFETAESGDVGVEVAREVVLEGKELASPMFLDGRIKPFHSARYSVGHGPTNYDKWVTASRPYRIMFEDGYEPYILVARKYVPWYDERFRGYRKNKVVHLMHLGHMGLQFIVHPRAFIVHSPHPRARAWKITHKIGLWDQMGNLYEEIRQSVHQNSYIPRARYACGDRLIGPLMARPEQGLAGGWA